MQVPRSPFRTSHVTSYSWIISPQDSGSFTERSLIYTAHDVDTSAELYSGALHEVKRPLYVPIDWQIFNSTLLLTSGFN
jgi:hypothetical protein